VLQRRRGRGRACRSQPHTSLDATPRAGPRSMHRRTLVTPSPNWSQTACMSVSGGRVMVSELSSEGGTMLAGICSVVWFGIFSSNAQGYAGTHSWYFTVGFSAGSSAQCVLQVSRFSRALRHLLPIYIAHKQKPDMPNLTCCLRLCAQSRHEKNAKSSFF
jgi:hypothetical protein